MEEETCITSSITKINVLLAIKFCNEIKLFDL